MSKEIYFQDVFMKRWQGYDFGDFDKTARDDLKGIAMPLGDSVTINWEGDPCSLASRLVFAESVDIYGTQTHNVERLGILAGSIALKVNMPMIDFIAGLNQISQLRIWGDPSSNRVFRYISEIEP